MALDQYKDAVSNMLSAALDLKLGDAAPSKGFVDGAGEGEAEELLEDEFTHSDRLPPSDSWTGYTTLPTRDPCGQDDDDPHAVKDDEAMMRADRREEVEEEKGNGDSYDHERLPPILSLSGYSPISADEPAADCGFAELPSDSRMNEDRIKATTHHVSTEVRPHHQHMQNAVARSQRFESRRTAVRKAWLMKPKLVTHVSGRVDAGPAALRGACHVSTRRQAAHHPLPRTRWVPSQTHTDPSCVR